MQEYALPALQDGPGTKIWKFGNEELRSSAPEVVLLYKNCVPTAQRGRCSEDHNNWGAKWPKNLAISPETYLDFAGSLIRNSTLGSRWDLE